MDRDALKGDVIETPQKKKSIMFAICVCICNESYDRFLITLKSIMRNVSLACRKDADRKLNPRDFVLFLIQDGREKISPDFLKQAEGRLLEQQAFHNVVFSNNSQNSMQKGNLVSSQLNSFTYDSNNTCSHSNLSEIQVSIHNDKPEEGYHLDDYALQKFNAIQRLFCFHTIASPDLFIEKSDMEEVRRLGSIQLQIVYAVKQLNRGKLDSHRFFFKGFCNDVDPQFCVMLDCGTRFHDALFFGYLRTRIQRPLMGAVCSEIQVEWSWRPMTSAQYIQYKLDQIMKSAEGLYGLVQILPGAHTCLRWEAVRGIALELYTQGTDIKNFDRNKDSLGMFKRNVYLTQDKLMTLLVMTLKEQTYSVEYLPSDHRVRAHSDTDTPGSVVSLLRQRRRWLNGGISCTVFGMLLYCKNYRHSHMRKHHCCRGFMLFLQLLYYLIQVVITVSIGLQIAIFYSIIPFFNHILFHGFTVDEDQHNDMLFTHYVFFGCTLAAIILSAFGNSKHPAVKYLFQVLHYCLMILRFCFFIGYGFMLYMEFTGQSLNKTNINGNLLIAVISLFHFSLMFIILFLIRPLDCCRRPHRFCYAFILYLLQTLTFFYLVKIYLVFNYHDVWWGSRASRHSLSKKIHCRYKCQNFVIVALWLISQAVLAWACIATSAAIPILFFFFVVVLATDIPRAFEALIFWWCRYYPYYHKRLWGLLKTKSATQTMKMPVRRAAPLPTANPSIASSIYSSEKLTEFSEHMSIASEAPVIGQEGIAQRIEASTYMFNDLGQALWIQSPSMAAPTQYARQQEQKKFQLPGEEDPGEKEPSFASFTSSGSTSPKKTRHSTKPKQTEMHAVKEVPEDDMESEIDISSKPTDVRIELYPAAGKGHGMKSSRKQSSSSSGEGGAARSSPMSSSRGSSLPQDISSDKSMLPEEQIQSEYSQDMAPMSSMRSFKSRDSFKFSEHKQSAISSRVNFAGGSLAGADSVIPESVQDEEDQQSPPKESVAQQISLVGSVQSSNGSGIPSAHDNKSQSSSKSLPQTEQSKSEMSHLNYNGSLFSNVSEIPSGYSVKEEEQSKSPVETPSSQKLDGPPSSSVLSSSQKPDTKRSVMSKLNFEGSSLGGWGSSLQSQVQEVENESHERKQEEAKEQWYRKQGPVSSSILLPPTEEGKTDRKYWAGSSIASSGVSKSSKKSSEGKSWGTSSGSANPNQGGSLSSSGTPELRGPGWRMKGSSQSSGLPSKSSTESGKTWEKMIY